MLLKKVSKHPFFFSIALEQIFLRSSIYHTYKIELNILDKFFEKKKK